MKSLRIKLLTLCFGGVSCVFAQSTTLKKPVVFTEVVKAKESYEKLIYPAQITSRMNARFNAEGDGIVSHIYKSVGSPVKKGETILIVQNSDPSYHYAPLKVQAPVSGVLAALDVSLGSQVNKGQGLGILVDPRNPKVLIEVPASDLAKIRIGQESGLLLNGYESPVKLKVDSKAPLVDISTGTGRVELSLGPNAGQTGIMVGRLGRVELRSDTRMSFLVPQDAVVYRDGKQFIRKIDSKDPGRVLARFAEIKLGAPNGENVEISSGINAGDTIILRSSAFVADGSEVEVFAPPPAAGTPVKPATQAR